MLACAIIIKRTFTNSVIYNLTETKLRRVLGVGKAKAAKLLVALKGSELFTYNEEHNFLLAKSLKSSDVKQYGYKRRRFKAKADFCKKLYETENKLSQIVRLLRETLLANMIDAPVKKSLTGRKKNNRLCDGSCTDAPIPLRKLAKAINMSRSSACRYIGRMEKDGKVSKSEIVAELVLPVYSTEMANEWMRANPGKILRVRYNFLLGRFEGWINHGRRYAVTDRKTSSSITNVIYNYRLGNRVNKVEQTNDYHENFYLKRVY